MRLHSTIALLFMLVASGRAQMGMDMMAMTRRMMTSPVVLCTTPDIAKDLGLSGDQKKAIGVIQKEHQKKVQELSKAQSGGIGAGMTALTQIDDMEKSATEAIVALLKPEQVVRLQQLEWQAQGSSAFYDLELQKRLEMTEDQVKKITDWQAGSNARLLAASKSGGTDPMKKARTQSTEFFNNLLTADQKTKLKSVLGPVNKACQQLSAGVMG